MSQLRILIVDDHEVSRRGIRSLLTSKTDWVVSEAMNDVEAVEKARIFRPDIVLMNISMPQMNGLEAMRMLGRELPSSKIVIVSQNDAHTTRRQAQELNAAAYLRKSDLSQDLLPTLNRLMGQANSSVPVKPENSKPISAPGNWLADGAAQFETLVNVAPLCAYLVDADFRIQQVNRPARLAAGDIPDSIGRDFNEMIPILWPKQSAGEIVRRFRHTLESGESYIAPERVEIRSDRGIHEIHEWQIHRVPLPDGRHGVVCYLLDNSEQVRAREVLRESEDRLRYLASIVDSSGDAIISKNLDGVITSWNRTAEQMYGYTCEEAIGRNITLILPPERLSEEKTILDRLKRGERVEHFETTRVGKDGKQIEVSLTISPVKDSDGRIVGASKVARDITERKQSERALVESERRLRALTDTLEEQVRIRTEELQRQNREIINQAKQLRELSQHLIQVQDKERCRIARELHDSVGQLLTALGMNLADITRYAKRDAPKLADTAEEGEALVRELSQEIRTMSYLLHPPLLDECGVSEALLWYIQGLKERSGLDVTLTISEDFGRVSRDLELAIFRIIQECLTNIHRHSGSKVARIRLARNERYISVEVEDEGKGIPAQKLVEIQMQGTGVGIRGMRERALQFGGELNIQSEGRGARVSITVPVKDAIDAGRAENLQQAETAEFNLQ